MSKERVGLVSMLVSAVETESEVSFASAPCIEGEGGREPRGDGASDCARELP